jgi:FkbM family methyltransferase
LEKIVDVRGIALSDREGTAKMSIAPEGVSNQGQGSLVNQSYKQLSVQCEVPTQTIDAFVASEKIERIDLMKVDIQGAEPLLLAGGKHVFGTMSPDLMMEVSPEDLVGMGRTSRDLLRQVEDYGYSIFTLTPDGRPSGRVRWSEVDENADFSNIYCTKSRG